MVLNYMKRLNFLGWQGWTSRRKCRGLKRREHVRPSGPKVSKNCKLTLGMAGESPYAYEHPLFWMAMFKGQFYYLVHFWRAFTSVLRGVWGWTFTCSHGLWIFRVRICKAEESLSKRNIAWPALPCTDTTEQCELSSARLCRRHSPRWFKKVFKTITMTGHLLTDLP